MFNWIVLFLSCYCVLPATILAQCDTGSCVCDTPAGRIDLRTLVFAGDFSYVSRGINVDYYYNLCGNGITWDRCDHNSAICQVVQTTNFYNVGSLVSEKIIVEGGNYYLQYVNGDDGRESRIRLICDEYSDTARFSYLGELAEKRYDFELITKCACPDVCSDGGPLPPPHSGPSSGDNQSGIAEGAIGITLMVLSIVAIVTYFIVGGIILHKKYEKRGMEIIPQKNFWFALPLLVKDGCVFTFTPLIHFIKAKAGYNSM